MEERHRHRFEVCGPLTSSAALYHLNDSLGGCSALNVVFVQVNPELKSHFEEKGFRFVGQDVEGERMEVIELDGMEAEAFCLYRCLLSGFLKVEKLQPSDHFFQNLKCPFQTIHISSECSTTQSSPLAPSSHHLLILDCYWPLLGSCRATYRRAAVCLHGKHTSMHCMSQLTRSTCIQAQF